MSEYASDTIVVRIGAEAKEELAARAAAADRSLSAETRRALRAWLERAAENEEDEDGR